MSRLWGLEPGSVRVFYGGPWYVLETFQFLCIGCTFRKDREVKQREAVSSVHQNSLAVAPYAGSLRITILFSRLPGCEYQTLARVNLPSLRVLLGSEPFPANAKPILVDIRRATAVEDRGTQQLTFFNFYDEIFASRL